MTVDDIRRHVLPAGTEVVAGAVGLDRTVTWPVTLRTRPPAFPHLKGGEMALISTDALRLLDPGLQLAAVLRSLAGMGVACAVVVGDVSPGARELCDSVGLALLSLPVAAHFGELEQQIARAIIDRRTELHSRGQEIYRRLTEIAIEGRGVDAILKTLADLTGKDVVLEDPSFVVRTCVVGAIPRCDADVLRALVRDADRIGGWLEHAAITASEPPTLRLALGGGLLRIVAPIGTRERLLGFLSVLGPAETVTELDEAAASRGAAACAIDLARERAVLEAEDRLQTDLIETLVTASYSSTEAIHSRARRLGFDLTGSFTVLLFGGPPARQLRAALENEVARLGLRAPIGSRGDEVILALETGGGAPEKRSLPGALRDALASALGSPVSAGVGRSHEGVAGIRASYQEARGALDLGGQLLGAGHLAHFSDLGLYRLLLTVPSIAELEGFFRDTLGALADYDRRTDGELLRTLEAYLASLGSPTGAAERLHVHRNTLLYRLRRIQEIAGVDLADAETRLGLHVGLRVQEVLRSSASPRS